METELSLYVGAEGVQVSQGHVNSHSKMEHGTHRRTDVVTWMLYQTDL